MIVLVLGVKTVDLVRMVLIHGLVYAYQDTLAFYAKEVTVLFDTILNSS